MSITAPSVVLLEDDADDAQLIREVLRRHLPEAEVRHAATRRDYLDLLDGDRDPVDVVLSDGSVPGCEGIEAYWLARRRHGDIAFIFVSGSEAPADLRGLQALGVSDFIAKDSLDDGQLLGTAIRTALRHSADGGGSLQDRKLLAGYELLVQTVSELSAARDLPVVLETPNDLTGYAAEIALLRNNF